MHVRKKIILAVLALLMAIAFGMTAVADDPEPPCRPNDPNCKPPQPTTACLPGRPCAAEK